MSVFESVHLPSDATEGNPLVTLVGGRKVHVENVRAIIEYDTSSVRLKTVNGELAVEGDGLSVDSFGDLSIVVKGTINCIRII